MLSHSRRPTSTRMSRAKQVACSRGNGCLSSACRRRCSSYHLCQGTAANAIAKVMDLESKNSQLTEELSTSRLNPAMMRNSIDWVPRGAARHTLTGHRATINCVAFHPLYNTCASASEDSSIKIWDWETGEFERTLKGHTKAVQDCDYDSKGQWLISCSSDLSIKLWDVPNDYSASKTFHGHDHSISSIRFLPDDERFASASRDQSIRIWEVATGWVESNVYAVQPV